MASFITLLLFALASSGVFSQTNTPTTSTVESDDNELEDTDAQQSATDAIEAANAGLGRQNRNIQINGDIATSNIRNAVPCTAKGCTWPKTRGIVRVPVYISTGFSISERHTIIRSLVALHSVSCIRFVYRRFHRDYLYILPWRGCWSYLGRQGGRQFISLQKSGCIYTSVIQHEALHALGFHHEQSRSDRDDFVNIITQNILPGRQRNFNKVATNNLGTPYDYNSVMHYSRFAFSKRRGVLPTIVPKPDATVAIGGASRMSANDIKRVNLLYQCKGF